MCYFLFGMKGVGWGGYWRGCRKYYFVDIDRSIGMVSKIDLEKDEMRYIVLEIIIIKVYCKLMFCFW